MEVLVYDAKVAVALLVFYLFYRFLLKKETFHRFNRVVLVGTAVLSFLLPLCIITIHKPIAVAPMVPESPALATDLPAQELVPLVEPAVPWWPIALIILFWAGVAFVLARVTTSILSIVRIIHRGQLVQEEDGCQIIVTERDIDPFSWMKYIVLSRKDWEAPHESILAHEKAHICLGHSMEGLLVDVLSALQWFNPAIWMLRADLQELHEYEADDAVLRAGTNIKEYQYLLIRKAVSKSGYSVANSFNHSILKNRITMMSKSKSPLSRGWRVLYLLPLVCLGLGLQARTVYVPVDKDSEKTILNENGEMTFTRVSRSAVQDSESTSPIVLNVRADGKVEGKDKVVPGAAVLINADNDTPMGVVNDLKQWLREVGGLKIYYSRPTETESVMRHIAPSVTNKTLKVATYDEALKGINRTDICVARINANDKIFFESGAYDKDADILRIGKAFLKEHGTKTVFTLTYDRNTSYGTYLRLQTLLSQIYNEVRDDKAREMYGNSLSALTEEQRSAILKLVPMTILETDMKG